jgi:hypothetical protein
MRLASGLALLGCQDDVLLLIRVIVELAAAEPGRRGDSGRRLCRLWPSSAEPHSRKNSSSLNLRGGRQRSALAVSTLKVVHLPGELMIIWHITKIAVGYRHVSEGGMSQVDVVALAVAIR